jgi:serine/threonine-protein kinase HipA
MTAARATGFAVAQTAVSDDGQILVVERFDMDPPTGQRLGFEDFCSLLGLAPEQKYDSTWERAARLVRDYVSGVNLRAANEQLAVTLLLTYALGNADGHTKNLALLYSGFDDVRVAPIYDMLTILAYDRYADNPPGMYIDGRKSWDATKAIWRYLQQHLGIEPQRQRELVALVCKAVASTVPQLLHHVRHTPGFANVGSRMLWEWNEGMKRMTDRLAVPIPDFCLAAEQAGLPAPKAPQRFASKRFGESELLAPRRRKQPPLPS